MRTFIGVELEDPTREAAGRAISELSTHLEVLDPKPDLRWVPPSSMHVTLHYVGHVDEPRLAALRELVAKPFDIPPFDLEFGQYGAFPESGGVSVLWLGMLSGTGSLDALHRELRKRLIERGFATEPRAYHPHMTLGRVKGNPVSGLRARLRECLAPPISASRIRAVTLFESRSASSGPEYVPLSRTPLTAFEPR